MCMALQNWERSRKVSEQTSCIPEHYIMVELAHYDLYHCVKDNISDKNLEPDGTENVVWLASYSKCARCIFLSKDKQVIDAHSINQMRNAIETALERQISQKRLLTGSLSLSLL